MNLRESGLSTDESSRVLGASPAVLFVPNGVDQEDAAVQFRMGSLQIQESAVEDMSTEQQRSHESKKENDNQAETFTVDKAVNQLGFGKFQLFLTLLCGLAWTVDAMETMILSILGPALLCEWRLSSVQEALITTVVFTGMLAGSSVWGVISDKYGRKYGLVLSSVFTFYFGILTAASPTFVWILILRCLTGVGIAGCPQAVTIYSEFVPTNYRAPGILLLDVFWAMGTIMATLIALVVMPSLGWPYLVLFCSLPLLVFIILCRWLPESARYYVVTGEKESAMKTIEQIAAWNNKPVPLGELVVESIDTTRGEFKDMLGKEYAQTTLLLWLLWFASAFVYYGIVLATTEIISELSSTDSSCITAAQDSDEDCWETCEQLQTADYVDILWTTIAELPGIVIAIVTVQVLGRKKALACQFALFGIFAFIVSFCMPRTLTTIMLFTARAFATAAFQSVYVYTCEVYPTTIRALGVGAGSGAARIGAIITPFVGQVLLKKTVTAAMSTYLAVGILAALAAMLLPLETKGRELKST